MTQIFSLLTKVSNNNINLSIYLPILILLWVSVAMELGLFIFTFIHLCLTKNTVKAKWWMLPVGLVLGGSLITSSILFNYLENPLPVEIWVAITTMGGLLVILLIGVYIVKIVNCVQAKKHHMSEKKWCAIMWAKYTAKRIVGQIALHGVAWLSKKMSPSERTKFYGKLVRILAILKRAQKNFEITKKGILSAISRIIENLKNGNYSSFEDFVNQEKKNFRSSKSVQKKIKKFKKASGK